MKKALLAIFITAAAVLSSCGGYRASSMTEGFTDRAYENKIIITVLDEKVYSDSAEINMSFKNTTRRNYTYGEEPYLEVLIGEKWYTVPLRDGASWDAASYTLGAGESQEYVLNISEYYELKNGYTYRFAKLFGENYDEATLSGTEFTVK